MATAKEFFKLWKRDKKLRAEQEGVGGRGFRAQSYKRKRERRKFLKPEVGI